MHKLRFVRRALLAAFAFVLAVHVWKAGELSGASVWLAAGIGGAMAMEVDVQKWVQKWLGATDRS
jgi:hypothetical protein